MLSHRFRSLMNVVLFLSVLSVNYLANALPINGITQREISAEYHIYLTPAGYVFAIWGIIYLGLSGYIITQALPSQRENPRLRSLDLPFQLSCICNMLWLIVWHYRHLTISVVIMFGLLASLIWIYRRLDHGRHQLHERSHWFVDQTFSIYLGWVALAMILNVAIWLDSMGWSGTPLSPQGWVVILLGIACILYLYLGFSRRDAAILGVLSWVSIGIAVKNPEENMINIACGIVCLICIFALFRILWQNQRLRHVAGDS